MTDIKFKTFAITIRPRDGYDESKDMHIREWIRKRCDYFHIISEKTGSERHIHAALFLKLSVTIVNFRNVLVRWGKNFGLDNDEISVLRKGVKILYNYDFIESYMDKDDDTHVIETCLPEKKFLESWFPPKPVSATTKKNAKHSKYYWELEQLWYEYTDPMTEINTINARHFLFRMMYSDRLIPVLRDDKAIVQVARHLTRWLKKEKESTIELAPFDKEE